MIKELQGRDRISVLQQKIKQLEYNHLNEEIRTSPPRPSSLQTGLESPMQMDSLELKYIATQKHFQKQKTQWQLAAKGLDEQISQLRECSKKYCRGVEKQFERNEQRLEQLEKSIIMENTEMLDDMRGMKNNAIQLIDSKFKVIKTETVKGIGEQIQTQSTQINNQLEQQLAYLSNRLESEQQHRDQTSEVMIKSFGDQIIKLQQIIRQERQQRINQHQKIVALLEENKNKMDNCLDSERKTMRKEMEGLQNMLQEVCQQIQARILGL